MASESLVVNSYKQVESSTTSTTKSHGSSFEEFQIYQGVMGRPGIDFPVYPQIPATSFTCRGVKKSGYYADLDTDCQVFHICDGNRKISFLCPNGTIFRQSHLICDWWFRVDCGKSVELYEESAEQLAADQKIYRARSEERERRRKLGKGAAEKGEELTGSEVYALDEPFQGRSGQHERSRNQLASTTVRTPQRNSSEGRKGERHSKKVVDSGITEKFPNYSREKIRTSKTEDRQGGRSVSAKVSFLETSATPAVESTPAYKGRQQTPNSIGFGSNKENIQVAESGSLVEDLSQRSGHLAYNKLGYDANGKINREVEFAGNQSRNAGAGAGADIHNRGTNGAFAAQTERVDEPHDRNINFNYDDRRAGEQTARNKFAHDDKKSHKTPFDYSKEGTEAPNEYGTGGYTTEFFNYESKRTDFAERQETLTPTFQTTKTQSSRYRSSTPPPPERERQFFAETASFHSNRGGKSYSDFHNQFNTFDKSVATTTASPQTTTLFAFPTTQSPPPRPRSTPNLDQSFRGTSAYRPLKQHSRKVTTLPPTHPQTTFHAGPWQTTTSQPSADTTASDRFTPEDIYFTTSTPEREVEQATEIQPFGVAQVLSEAQIRYDTATPKPDVDITLQELNINKTPTPAKVNKSYDDVAREGLEVPPSSGPNAIRTFALYFATTNNNDNNNLEETRTTAHLPTEPSEMTTTLTPFEMKKKEVVKQVDDLVQRSSLNTSDPVSQSENLPDSLTPHTQNSYSALFPVRPVENSTGSSAAGDSVTENHETTAFESYTEEPNTINEELTKNDLDGSQSRGLVEPDPHSDTEYSKVSPDLRELAQVFTKALSAYLDDPEAFRRVLSEIRPTEPTDSEVTGSDPSDYPSATQEVDEVLDFSDVTKSSYKKKTSTPTALRETTTEYGTEAPPTNTDEIENLVLPLNHTGWATNLQLTAPLLESLHQSQTSYYTPPSYIPTTNAIAEEINNQFTAGDGVAPTDSDLPVDSYLPIRGTVHDSSLPRYGGFHNNANHSPPHGAQLTSTTYLPYGADLTPTPNAHLRPTTFNPDNATSFFDHFPNNESDEGEIQLAKELNNLVLLHKFTTPRGTGKDPTTPRPDLSTHGQAPENDPRTGKALRFPEPTLASDHFEPDAKQISLDLGPPPATPKGFLITYSIGPSSSAPATYLPTPTSPALDAHPRFENFSQRLERLTHGRTSTDSIQRLAQLQQTLMFNARNITPQQRDQARASVEDMMDKMNITDSAANTLMKVMEMAAKNETYRRLVLLLVNDKSGKNKTAEESRLALLKALLTPVISPPRTVVPIPETSRLGPTEQTRRSGSRRSKSISSDNAINVDAPTTKRSSAARKTKTSRGLARAEASYSSGLGNLGVIRRTLENSKNKPVRIDSIDDAILDSDSRAVDLLRSLYSLAARWG